MYLCSTLADSDYVRFPVHLTLPNIIAHYKLQPLILNGYIYTRIKMAWYSLKQSGKIAHDSFVAHLLKYGYQKAPQTENLFLHETQDILITPVVNDFGVKSTLKEDIDHLVEGIRNKYPFKIVWDAEKYFGMHPKWNYDKRTIRVSMDGYVIQALKEFEHHIPKQRHYGPSKID